MNIVVLGGCGDMGSYVVHDLVEFSDAHVTIADCRLEVARADVRGRKPGEPQTLSFATLDKMGRLTGIPAAIGALMLARGKIAPEGLLDPDPFFAELAKRDVRK